MESVRGDRLESINLESIAPIHIELPQIERGLSLSRAREAVSNVVAPQSNFIKKWIAKGSHQISKHLFMSVLIVILIFTFVNAFIFYNYPLEAFDNPKPASVGNAVIDGLYFTSTTMSTVGFGDICPISGRARLYVILMQLTGLFLGMRLFDATSKLHFT